jgi:hypothetical protein
MTVQVFLLEELQSNSAMAPIVFLGFDYAATCNLQQINQYRVYFVHLFSRRVFLGIWLHN